MKKYGLFTKKEFGSEIIHRTEANSIEEAAEIFANIKKLSIRDLTSIFDIKSIK